MSERLVLLDGTTRLRLADRHVKPLKGDATLLVTVEHRTTGSGRSVLLTREQAQVLRHALGEWLDWADAYEPEVARGGEATP
jgi:hypothetical protein